MLFPAPSTRQWPYKEWSKFGIEAREKCAKEFLEKRFKNLVKKINYTKRKPKVVILYGRQYTKEFDIRNEWKKVIDVSGGVDWPKDFVDGGTRKSWFEWRKNKSILFFYMAQPASMRGSKKEICERIGGKIKKLLDGSD